MNHLGLVECIDPMMPQDFNQRTVSRDIPLLWRGARRAGYSPPLEGCPQGGVVVE
jgi:hypothetical protein